MAFKFIVETFLGYKRPNKTLTQEFMEYRVKFFRDYTLNSLQNQSFKDFTLIIHTAPEWKHLIKSVINPEKINMNGIILSDDNAREFYSGLNAKHIIISRIDSDDMFHRHAMRNVHERITNGRLFLKSERAVLAFKDNICWDMLNGCIIPHKRNSTPFYTHVFPQRIYKKWPIFVKQHFCQHGQGGAGDRSATPLDPGMVCVIKHGKNWSLLKRGLPPFKLTDEQIRILKETGSSDYGLYAYEGAIWDKVKQQEILTGFGVKLEEI
jgi:hypothetical protein